MPTRRGSKTIHNHEDLRNTRRLLRNNPTNGEKLLWSGLKNKQLGYKFRRQHGIGSFIVDFYCSKLRLVIEVDGETHNDKDVQENDKRKERFLKDNYFKVIRFTDDRVMGNIEKVLEEINLICEKIGTAS